MDDGGFWDIDASGAVGDASSVRHPALETGWNLAVAPAVQFVGQPAHEARWDDSPSVEPHSGSVMAGLAELDEIEWMHGEAAEAAKFKMHPHGSRGRASTFVAGLHYP